MVYRAYDDGTPMERMEECKGLMLQGLSIPQISRITGYPEGTVRSYVRQILNKEGVSSRLELLAFEIERLKRLLEAK